jgi:SAM-dependent methyltransferase
LEILFMAKQGEIDYLKNLSPEQVVHAVNKPFSDDACDAYLMEMAAVMSLLPPPPVWLLDVGCGTGWTSLFFAKRGYNVVGVDIAEDMIHYANATKEREGLENVHFEVADYETMQGEADFDCAVFYSSLHHALDEEQALRMVYRCLKPGGVCITSEPGKGHGQSAEAIEAVARYDVTERDMPPRRIIKAGKKAGFGRFRTYPHAPDLKWAAYSGKAGRFLGKLARKVEWCRKLATLTSLAKILFFGQRKSGIVSMVKPIHLAHLRPDLDIGFLYRYSVEIDEPSALR